MCGPLLFDTDLSWEISVQWLLRWLTVFGFVESQKQQVAVARISEGLLPDYMQLLGEREGSGQQMVAFRGREVQAGEEAPH